MKKWGLLLITTFLIVACGDNVGLKNNKTDNPNNPTATKKIQPGVSLNFICPDSFRKTELEIRSIWDNSSSTWTVSLQEFNRSGKLVFSLNNLVGQPDEIESLHMNLNKGSELFARIVQNGQSEAIYKDGQRVLNCIFQ